MSWFVSVKADHVMCGVQQILKGKLNLPPYLTNEARALLKKVGIPRVMKLITSII